MKRTKLTLAALLIVTLIATTALAWGPGRGGGRWGGGGYGGQGGVDCPRYGQQIDADLTQEQQDQLAALRQKFIDDTFSIRSERIAKKQEFRLLMQTSDPDKEKLSELSNTMLELDKALMDKQIDYQLEVKKIAPELTPFMGRGPGKGFGKGRGGFQGAGRF